MSIASTVRIACLTVALTISGLYLYQVWFTSERQQTGPVFSAVPLKSDFGTISSSLGKTPDPNAKDK